MKLTDYVVAFLEKKGVRDFFGYQGTMIAHLVDSVERNPRTRNHSCYNEQGAAFAACGYAQAKNDCACAYATSGPGAVNLLSGVADAYFDSLPVIFLTGQLNTYEYSGIPGLRQQGFQEIDIVSMARPVTKYCAQVREPERIVEELEKAYRIAMSGRRGPVLLDLPMNVQRGEVDVRGKAAVCPENDENSAGLREKAEEAAQAVCEALGRSRRPAILMGNGVDRPESQAGLLRFAEKHGIPVITSVLAKSSLPGGHPLNLGCIGGAYGHRYANMVANAKSDLLLCFGISLCTRQIGVKVHEFAKNAELVRIDIDPCNLRRDIHENALGEQKFCADTGEVIRLLNQRAGDVPESFGEWAGVCREIRRTLQRVDEETPERYPNRLIAGLGKALSAAGAVAVDVGQHMVWSYQSLECAPGQKLLFSGGHGAMGYALPAAIGAYCALGRPVACICGDGALQMNIQELQWVKREGIPVKIIVMNNGALGMIRHLQKDYFDSLFAGTVKAGGFSSCEFHRVAEAYGIPAMRLEAREILPEADGRRGSSAMGDGDPRKESSLPENAARFLAEEGPGLLEIVLEEETYAYPKTCLGEPVHNQQPYMPAEIYEYLLRL